VKRERGENSYKQKCNKNQIILTTPAPPNKSKQPTKEKIREEKREDNSSPKRKSGEKYKQEGG